MATPVSRNIRQEMADAMPRYYDGSYVIGNILDQESAEMDALNTAANDVLAQFYVDTATWGLTRWERICGITTDVSKPIEQRRSVVRSKLRGMGTVTVAMIKNVAEAFDNGDVSVAENVKNMLPPLTDPSWTKAVSAVVSESYKLTLTATASGQFTSVPIQVVVGQPYTVKIVTTGDSNIRWNVNKVRNSSNNAMGGNQSTTTAVTFVPDATPVYLNLYSNGAGTYVFEQMQVERGYEATKFEPRKDYTIDVKFVSSRGVPSNLSDIQTALRDIIPAHLAINFLFTFLTFGELVGAGLTFGGLEAQGLTFGALETWDPTP